MTTPPDQEAYSNPVRLSVATRESGSSSNAIAGPSTTPSSHVQPEPLNERERLLKARKANELVRRKGEKWADKLMEETVDRETFKKALRYITSQTYLEITSERHLNNFCSYPLCSKPPLAPYNPQKRFRISTLNRSITEVEGNKEEGYCTRACRVKSEWVRRKLEEGGSVLGRGKGWEVELVEDLGLDLDDVSGIVNGQRDTKTENKAGKGHGSISTNGNNSPWSSQSVMDQIRQTSPISERRRQPISHTPLISSPKLSSPSPPISLAPNNPIDMLANLHIHERPTTSPSISSPRPQSKTTLSTISPIKSKRAPTSIVGEQSKLAQTVLKASKAINPIPQVNPDSDDEGEHQEVEWEREAGLGWGEGTVEEGDGGGDIWEAMRAARELDES